MGENTGIQWANHTFNPWIGCTKVSEACHHCYAESEADHRFGLVKWGPAGHRHKTAAANWRKPIQWDKRAAKLGIRYRVFCASWADVFEDNDELLEWRAELMALIEATPNLDWLLLTKRPEAVATLINAATSQNHNAWLRANPHVWVGTSIETQKRLEERMPHLLELECRKFLSLEPLLEPVNLTGWAYRFEGALWQPGNYSDPLSAEMVAMVDEVIIGGESGQFARGTLHPAWVDNIRKRCQEAGVPFMFKQWGEWVPWVFWGPQTGWICSANGGHKSAGELSAATIDSDPAWQWGERHGLYQEIAYQWVGKKVAGRKLDGHYYDGVMGLPEWQEYAKIDEADKAAHKAAKEARLARIKGEGL